MADVAWLLIIVNTDVFVSVADGVLREKTRVSSVSLVPILNYR